MCAGPPVLVLKGSPCAYLDHVSAAADELHRVDRAARRASASIGVSTTGHLLLDDEPAWRPATVQPNDSAVQSTT